MNKKLRLHPATIALVLFLYFVAVGLNAFPLSGAWRPPYGWPLKWNWRYDYYGSEVGSQWHPILLMLNTLLLLCLIVFAGLLSEAKLGRCRMPTTLNNSENLVEKIHPLSAISISIAFLTVAASYLRPYGCEGLVLKLESFLNGVYSMTSIVFAVIAGTFSVVSTICVMREWMTSRARFLKIYALTIAPVMLLSSPCLPNLQKSNVWLSDGFSVWARAVFANPGAQCFNVLFSFCLVITAFLLPQTLLGFRGSLQSNHPMAGRIRSHLPALLIVLGFEFLYGSAIADQFDNRERRYWTVLLLMGSLYFVLFQIADRLYLSLVQNGRPQLHLSTCVVAMFSASILLWLNIRPRDLGWSEPVYGWPEAEYQYGNPNARLGNFCGCLMILLGIAGVCEFLIARQKRQDVRALADS